ncbi:hypothetical protein BH24ACI3_BH24ACI3_14950 [soil metagenome]
MRVCLLTIFVLMTFTSFPALAGDPAESTSKTGSPEASDKKTTARKGPIGQNFANKFGLQNVVSIGGWVRTPFGAGIPNATVVLMDMNGNIQYTVSASFGYFILPDVVAGEMYVLSIRHRRYIFAFPAQVIEINKPTMDFEFIGERNF